MASFPRCLAREVVSNERIFHLMHTNGWNPSLCRWQAISCNLHVNMASGSLEVQELFISCIKSNEDVENLQATFIDAPGNEGDKKSILEQAFRDALQEQIETTNGLEVNQYTKMVHLSINSAGLGICYHSVPFILLTDILDYVTLDVCEKVFEFVENRVSTWIQPDFYGSGKILLLRMCNDLLRRLSSAQNTVFCGRIQLFLARLFPLSEKSALNLMSHFNLENVTTYNKEAGMGEEKETKEKDEEAMDIEDSDPIFDSSAPIDFNLYHKLWSLQDFFRQPTQSFVPEQWKLFTANILEVLQAFASYKLEDTTGSSSSSKKKKKKKGEKQVARASLVEYTESHYFAKFLTSEKLMSLQLQDSHFRRHVLIQILVLFQYLTSDVKFKTQTQMTSDAQALWIKETTEKVFELIRETPPNGVEFADYIKQALKREENWIAWKNDGCPSYEKPPLSNEEMTPYPQRQNLLHVQPSKKYDLGNPELSRLWNLCPDNLQACRMKTRTFVPDLERFVEEPNEQADPEARIEAEYKVINNPNFAWQALRLLSRSSSHFFQNTTAQIKPLPEYLEHVIVQTAKDLQNSQ